MSQLASASDGLQKDHPDIRRRRLLFRSWHRGTQETRSLMLVTALAPVIGYDKASAIAHKANDQGLTLKQAALASEEIDEKRFDEIVDPKKMVGHGVAGKLKPRRTGAVGSDWEPREESTMIKQSISFGIALAVLFLAGRASAQDHPCSKEVAFILSEYGIKMSDIKNANFRTDRFEHQGGTENGPIDDYEFTGQPAACSSGGMFVSLSTGCEIEDAHTYGDCRIKGLPHWWW